MFTRLLANCAVSDAARAEDWYTLLFAREPDTRPMGSLLEWHLTDTFGVQTWVDPGRAGHSTIVVAVTELDTTASRLAEAGIEHDGPRPGGGSRILQVADPDGNSVVFTEA